MCDVYINGVACHIDRCLCPKVRQTRYQVKNLRKMKLCILIALAFVGVYADEPDKLVNGESTSIEKYPHVVSMRLNNQHMCGGSIIDEVTILTAAHCVQPFLDPRQRKGLTVVSGTTLLSKGGVTHKIATLIAHEKYHPNGDGSHDIGLIKLAAPIEFDENTKAIGLPTSNLERGEPLTLVAWGSTGFLRPVHDDLRKLDVKCMLPEECQRLNRLLKVHESEFCTLVAKGTGACNGDSGSGVVRDDNTIVGTVSRGIPCARGLPDVFTDVVQYVDWIISKK